MRHGCDFVTITGAVTFGRARESLAPAAKQPFSGSADPCECKCVTWFRTTEQPGSWNLSNDMHFICSSELRSFCLDLVPQMPSPFSSSCRSLMWLSRCLAWICSPSGLFVLTSCRPCSRQSTLSCTAVVCCCKRRNFSSFRQQQHAVYREGAC